MGLAAQLRLLQPLRHVQGGRIVPARRAVLLLWLLVLWLLVLRLLVLRLLVMLLLVMLLLVLRLLVLLRRLLVLLRRRQPAVLGSWRLPPRLARLHVPVVNPALLVLIRFPPRRKLMIQGEDPSRALEGVSTAADVSAKARRVRSTQHRANRRRSRREACESQHARDLATNRHLRSRRRVG